MTTLYHFLKKSSVASHKGQSQDPYSSCYTSTTYSKIILFTDDTVILTSAKSKKLILNTFHVTYILNDLILNTEKRKTETVLIATSINLAKNSKLNVYFNGSLVIVTTSYTHLGTEINHHLNMDEQFNKAYRSMSSKLHLLKKLLQNYTFQVAKSVYQSVVVPIFSFDCIVNLNISRSKVEKLSSIQQRASMIINIHGDKLKPDHLYDVSCFQAGLLVKKCLDGLTCQSFHNYFKFNTHNIRTHNQRKLLILPDVWEPLSLLFLCGGERFHLHQFLFALVVKFTFILQPRFAHDFNSYLQF